MHSFTRFIAIFILGSSSSLFAQNKSGQEQKVKLNARQIAVVYAFDGKFNQPSLDFYRDVFVAVFKSESWDSLPIAKTRKALPDGEEKIGGIPSIDRKDFRASLPKKLNSNSESKIIKGKSVPELQRMLDNLGAPAAIVVDCLPQSSTVLKACGLYYYDRSYGRVIASSVKKFESGVNDASKWAQPMIVNLEEGINASIREKDETIIEELVARKEDDEREDAFGLLGIVGQSSRLSLNSGWDRSIVGAGLHAGYMIDNKGLLIDVNQLAWSGSGDFTEAKQTSYGINMLFRAKALESLLWIGEIGAGKQIRKLTDSLNKRTVESSGMYVAVKPAIGLDLAEFFAMDLSLNWLWYFEQSASKAGPNTETLSFDAVRIPGVALRAMFIL